ncbi:MAG: hypothetical protein L6N96_04775, partial [Candidatus Methylarchaceae archaeon HK02M2]|nr:hypothetical protein [Candidatus Methylarchaceae archaeon HK02M2]
MVKKIKKKENTNKRNEEQEERITKDEIKETMDIYNDEQREEMLEDDEITSAESAFMAGREMNMEKGKKKLVKH